MLIAKASWNLATLTLTGTSLLTMPTPDNGQLGLWIACMIAVMGSISALLIAYRTLTKDFVTKTELQVELGKLTAGFEEGLKETRHEVANKINAAKLQLEAKIDTMASHQIENARILGRIEGLLEVRRTESSHESH